MHDWHSAYRRDRAAAVKNGAKVILPKYEIPTVGHLIKIQDPDGNVVCVKQPATA